MYYISQPPGFSPEDHITVLEEMYCQCFEDKVDVGTMADIWDRIQALQEKLKEQEISISQNKRIKTIVVHSQRIST